MLELILNLGLAWIAVILVVFTSIIYILRAVLPEKPVWAKRLEPVF